MGIVTDIFMIIALGMALKNSHPIPLTTFKSSTAILLYCFFAVAFWNVTWYASQNFHHFWGKMSLLSGLSMLLVSLSLTTYYQQNLGQHINRPWIILVAKVLLFLCILQYSKTLILLNLE